MHIHEAILSGSMEGVAILCGGAVATAIGTAIGLRNLDYEQVPRVAVVTSVFFVVSLIHVPLGGTSVHLVLNGLVGLILGWAAFPALLIALLLQAIMFGHGGLLALGINTLAMASPAVLSYYLFHRVVTAQHNGLAFTAGFSAGALAMLSSAVLIALALWIAHDEFDLLAQAMVAFHLAVAVIEGLVSGSVVLFLRKVRPETLNVPLLATAH